MEAGSGTPTSPVGGVTVALLVKAEVQVDVPLVLNAVNIVPTGFAKEKENVCGSWKVQPGSCVPAVIVTPSRFNVVAPKPLSVSEACDQE